MDQSTVSRCIWRVTAAILEVCRDAFEFKSRSTKDGFHEKFGLPSVLGTIVCNIEIIIML